MRAELLTSGFAVFALGGAAKGAFRHAVTPEIKMARDTVVAVWEPAEA